MSGVAGAGLAGWLADVAILWFSHEVLGIHPSIAAAMGFLTAGAVNFTLNRRVFSAVRGRAPTQVGRYGVLFVINLLVIVVTVPLLAGFMDIVASRYSLSLVAAKVAVTCVLVPINTLAYGVWVFKD